jgi:orotidine-5'-phosphate decarboxylase
VEPANFADRVADAIELKRTQLVVGLDPRLDLLPMEVRGEAVLGRAGGAAAVERFCRGIIDAVGPYVVGVKPQSAFFEALGADGIGALERVCEHARSVGLLIVLDAKRGDIGSTARAYSAAYLEPDASRPPLADAITASPYLGDDSLQPLVDHCASGRGVFVLTRTSNPGASLLQEVEVDGRPLFLRVADLVRELGAAHVGEAGYSDVGAVAGATAPAQLRQVREALPNAFLLVPGYGAQGAGADALAGIAAGDAAGFVVNASRSIIFAWQDAGGDYRRAAAAAAESMRSELQDTL